MEINLVHLFVYGHNVLKGVLQSENAEFGISMS